MRPATGMVGTISPEDYDGIAELRFAGVVGAVRNIPHSKAVYFDEQNPFETVIGYQTGQSRGRWWTERLDDSVGHRTVVMIRQRKGTRSRDFRTFIHDELGRALHGAGAQDLRTYTFMRYIAAMWSTPGVNHAGPAHRRHHAALVIGADSRQQFDDILKSTEVTAVIDRQERHITAAHAYTVDRTVPGIRMKP